MWLSREVAAGCNSIVQHKLWDGSSDGIGLELSTTPHWKAGRKAGYCMSMSLHIIPYLFSLPIFFHWISEKSEIVADWSELACSQTICLP